MRIRPLLLAPLAAAALLLSGCMAETAPAPSSTTPSSTTPAPASTSAAAPSSSSAASSSTSAPKPVKLRVQVSWIPEGEAPAENVTGGINLFVNGSAVDTHTSQNFPAAGTAPLTLQPTVYPGDQVLVLVSPNPSRTPGKARCQILTDTQTAPLDARTGGAGTDAVVQCKATVPATPAP